MAESPSPLSKVGRNSGVVAAGHVQKEKSDDREVMIRDVLTI
jgi:hypothetical protein